MAERRVICAQCHQGRHSNKGAPEYGDSDCCPDERCQCQCRDAKVLADVHKAFAKVEEAENNAKRVMGVLRALDKERKA